MKRKRYIEGGPEPPETPEPAPIVVNVNGPVFISHGHESVLPLSKQYTYEPFIALGDSFKKVGEQSKFFEAAMKEVSKSMQDAITKAILEGFEKDGLVSTVAKAKAKKAVK